MSRWCQPGRLHRDADSRPRGSGDDGGSKGGSKDGRKGGSKGRGKDGRKGGSKGGSKGRGKGRGRQQKSWKGRGRGWRQPKQSRVQPEWSGDEDMSMLQLKKAATCLRWNHSCISKFWMSMTGLISAGFIWSCHCLVWDPLWNCGRLMQGAEWGWTGLGRQLALSHSSHCVGCRYWRACTSYRCNQRCGRRGDLP